ncbi:MAG TPA: hypothetical protein VIP11_05235, partial [Gemmatimonadaceae bacterium]
DIRQSALLLYAGVHQAVFAFLGAVSGGLAYTLSSSGRRTFAVIAWVVCAGWFVAMFTSMFRVRGLKRILRGRRPL